MKLNNLNLLQCESCGKHKPENVCDIARNEHRKHVAKMCFCDECHAKFKQSGIEVADFNKLRHLNRTAYAFRIRKLKKSIQERLGYNV